jgi:hypothetical protein
LETICDKDLLLVFENDMVIGYAPGGGVVFERLPTVSTKESKTRESLLTVFRSEQSTDSTTCLSGQVAMYVIALTPLTGRMSAIC